MGLQSSRILFGGTDSKDIIFNGMYHRQMFLGNQLVWEKLADEEGVFALRTAWASKFEFSVKGDVTVDWGDGTIDTNNSHTYAGNGAYTIVIRGNPEYLQFGYIHSLSQNDSPIEIVYTPLPKGIKDTTWVFRGCDTLKTVPENFFVNCRDSTSLNQTFMWCYNFENIPAGLLKGMVNVKSITQMFMWTKASVIPEGLFDDLVSCEDFRGAFCRCLKIESIPPTLFDKCEKANKFGNPYSENPGTYEYDFGTFGWCHQITSNVPELWNKFPNADSLYCFGGCRDAANYDSIPKEWK